MLGRIEQFLNLRLHLLQGQYGLLGGISKSRNTTTSVYLRYVSVMRYPVDNLPA
jgi:hypothetical protein